MTGALQLTCRDMKIKLFNENKYLHLMRCFILVIFVIGHVRNVIGKK
jgi:hypothetical protein